MQRVMWFVHSPRASCSFSQESVGTVDPGLRPERGTRGPGGWFLEPWDQTGESSWSSPVCVAAGVGGPRRWSARAEVAVWTRASGELIDAVLPMWAEEPKVTVACE